MVIVRAKQSFGNIVYFPFQKSHTMKYNIHVQLTLLRNIREIITIKTEHGKEANSENLIISASYRSIIENTKGKNSVIKDADVKGWAKHLSVETLANMMSIVLHEPTEKNEGG